MKRTDRFLTVIAHENGQWREVLLSPKNRLKLERFIANLYKGSAIPVSPEILPLEVYENNEEK